MGEMELCASRFAGDGLGFEDNNSGKDEGKLSLDAILILLLRGSVLSF